MQAVPADTRLAVNKSRGDVVGRARGRSGRGGGGGVVLQDGVLLAAARVVRWHIHNRPVTDMKRIFCGKDTR
jgi:hypothetical protein